MLPAPGAGTIDIMLMARHDHQLHEGDALRHAARDRLTKEGEQWTDMRASVFDALAGFDKPASAYDIADAVSKKLGMSANQTVSGPRVRSTEAQTRMCVGAVSKRMGACRTSVPRRHSRTVRA